MVPGSRLWYQNPALSGILVKTYNFNQSTIVPADRQTVFAFFADAANLNRLSPPWIRFEILTPTPISMETGATIDYRLRIRGIPLRWQSEIAEWKPPTHFTDIQSRGPYTFWRHTHRFEEHPLGTRCLDEVTYRPLGGALINALFVRRDLQKIFAYRTEQLQAHFGG